jgi:glycosyltransferase involved in cell wall biosynthesis
VQSAAVVPLGGFSDAVARKPPIPYEQRSHVLIGASPDPRDDLSWALRVYDLGTAHVANAPRAIVIGLERIQDGRQRGTLDCVGFVSENRLMELHTTALAYLHPSSFEGFGLPIVEAMQCGTPVFAPSGSAVDEVAGDSAFGSVEAAAHELQEILESRKAWVTASMSAWHRGNEYQWHRCARDLSARMLSS